MCTGIAVSGAVASFFREPQVQPLFMVTSVGFLLVSLGLTQAALFQREMNFRAISLRLLIAQIGGAIAGITVAALGGGPWAFIALTLTVSSLSTLFLWLLSSWRPRFTFSRSSLRDLGSFGGRVFAGRVLDYAQSNADNVLVGRFLGSVSLGLYSVAYNVMLLPIQRMIIPLQEVMYPALSRIQHDLGRLAKLWLRTTRAVGAVIAPCMLGLIVVAPDFVNVVLGPRWQESTRVIQILATVALMRSFTAVAERVLLALNHAPLLVRFSLLRTTLSIAAFVIGLHWGIVGVAAGYAIVTLPVQVYLMLLVTRVLSIRTRVFLRSMSGVLEAALAMFAGCWVARELLLQTSVGPAVRLVAVTVIGALVYLPIAAWRNPELVADVRSLRRRRATGEAPALTG
jgi:PST family polysaccharide transporter